MGNVKEKLNAEERAYRLLTETIKQSYKPGDFILESSLAIDFGMSRTPISIALNRLVSEGILKKVPKKAVIFLCLNMMTRIMFSAYASYWKWKL